MKKDYEEGVMQTKHNQRQPLPFTKVRVVESDAVEQANRIQAAIAARAFELFERHGRVGGRELEDWEQAKGEILSSLDFGVTTRDHTLLL